MEGAQLFLMVFGAFLAITGIALFIVLIWLKKSIRGRSTIKLFRVEISLSHPALLIFVIGCILMVIPFSPIWGTSVSPQELIQDVSTSIQTPGTTNNNELDIERASRFFMLGYYFWDTFDIAYWTVTSDLFLSEDYQSSVYHLVQSADIVHLNIEVPKQLEWTNSDEVLNYFLDKDREIQAKLEVEDSLSLYPYDYGKWTRRVLTSIIGAFGEEKEGVQQWLGDVIDDFDNNVRGFLHFNIGNEIISEYDYLYLDLVSLKRVGIVTEEDYYGILDRIQRIIALIKAEGGL